MEKTKNEQNPSDNQKQTQIESMKELLSSMKLTDENPDKEMTKDEKVARIQKFVLLFKAISTLNIVKTDYLPVEILDNKVYIGSIGAANNKEELKKAGITHIVNAACTVKCNFPEDFEYLKLDDLLDSPDANIKQHFEKSNGFIHSALNSNGRVFVHCHAGISRSSTLIIAYMIKHLNYSFDKALEHCKSRRSKVNPNEGFKKQLREYEQEIKKLNL